MPPKKIFLFDVDGTLTESRKLISTKMRDFLFNEVMSKVDVALVGGSDLKKISEQMGGDEGCITGHTFIVINLNSSKIISIYFQFSQK